MFGIVFGRVDVDVDYLVVGWVCWVWVEVEEGCMLKGVLVVYFVWVVF